MDPTTRFSTLVAGSEDALAGALGEAALLIAAHAHSGLDVGAYLERLDQFARDVPAADLDSLVHHIFRVERFSGNTEHFEDPANSYLDAVIDRRLGIPITLSVVLMEVGRRVGITLQGVGMPNRFLVRHDGPQGPVFIDAFDGGLSFDADECAKRFSTSIAPGAVFDPEYLQPVGSRALLARMLGNLKAIQAKRQSSRDLAWVLRLRTAIPGVPLRERAELAQALHATGRFLEAAEVLEHAADMGTSEAAERLRSRARLLRARLN